MDGCEIFNSRDPAFRAPFGAVAAGCAICFTVKPGGAAAARLLVRADDETEPVSLPMAQTADGFTVHWAPPASGLWWYWFEADFPAAQTRRILRGESARGVLADAGGSPPENAVWQLTVYAPGLRTPDRFKGGVLYQIFPDRFAREGPLPPAEEVPSGRVLREDWGAQPEWRPDGGGEIRNNDYFGGNLRGIAARLPYLKSLGVTALYLNPVFEAHSNHRYNTADYAKIDPLLGGEEDFRSLCEQAAECGVGVVLDGVFNHTGDDSVYFNRQGRYPAPGAFQSKESAWYLWYLFRTWPDDYACWWGFKTLPAVDKTGPFADFIAGPGGIVEKWLRAGASGWRLDVADELPEPFLQQIAARVKAVKPEALLLGEVWEDASNKISYGHRRHYFQGGELDSVMNYPLRAAILHFFSSGDAAALDDTVMTELENDPKPVVDVTMNLLSTHDTERVLTVLAGEPANGRGREWKAAQALSPAARERGLRLLTLAAAVQFFLPGIPCVYYGDEAGMEGYDDPFNRGCYPWGDAEPAVLNWYRLLGRLRGACPALREGDYRCLAAEHNFYAFMRTDGPDALLCAVNLGDAPKEFMLPEPKGGIFPFIPVDGLSGATIARAAVIPAGGCRICGAGEWTSRILRTSGMPLPRGKNDYSKRGGLCE